MVEVVPLSDKPCLIITLPYSHINLSVLLVENNKLNIESRLNGEGKVPSIQCFIHMDLKIKTKYLYSDWLWLNSCNLGFSSFFQFLQELTKKLS